MQYILYRTASCSTRKSPFTYVQWRRVYKIFHTCGKKAIATTNNQLNSGQLFEMEWHVRHWSACSFRRKKTFNGIFDWIRNFRYWCNVIKCTYIAFICRKAVFHRTTYKTGAKTGKTRLIFSRFISNYDQGMNYVAFAAFELLGIKGTHK